MSRQAFTAMFQCIRKELAKLGWTDVRLAQYLQVSRPTVWRWAQGKTAPHRIGRERTIDGLERELAARGVYLYTEVDIEGVGQ